MERPGGIFGRLSGWASTHAWAVLGAWSLLAVALAILAPPLKEVSVREESSFLPSDAQSVRGAVAVERAWPGESLARVGTLVFSRPGGLTEEDRAFVARAVSWLTSRDAPSEVEGVQSAGTAPELRPYLVSQDGTTELVLVRFRTSPFEPHTNAAVERIRRELARERPPGLEVHLTGQAGIGADEGRAIETAISRTTAITVALIIVILVWIYRSPVTPLVSLVSIGLAYLVARGVVALLARSVMKVSFLVETMMVVLVFGAGTDYCLFLISRFREELERRAGEKGILGITMSRLAGVIASSAGTVMVAFLTQAVARFGMYRTVGPALAVAVGVTLLAGLSLVPALLKVLGRFAFWPALPAGLAGNPGGGAGSGGPGLSSFSLRAWEWTGALVRRRPWVALVASLALLVPPALVAARIRSDRDVLRELPASSDSVIGYRTIAAHFSPGAMSPLEVVVESDSPLLEEAAFSSLDLFTQNVARIPGVEGVRSLTRPAGGPVSPAELAGAGLGDVPALPAKVREGAGGLGQAIDGLSRIRSGLVEMEKKLPELSGGLGRALSGADEMRRGISRMREGLGRVRSGVLQARDAATLLAGAADTAASSVQGAWDALQGMTVGKADPNYLKALEEVGTAYAALTGRDPRTGERVRPDYPGLPASLRQLASGLDQAAWALGQIDQGLAQLDRGLEEMGSGLGKAGPGVQAMRAGIGSMVGGLDRVIPGLALLRQGLEEGVAKLESLGLLEALERGEMRVPVELVRNVPEVRKKLSYFLAPGERTTRLFVTLGQDPYSPTSLGVPKRILEAADRSFSGGPLDRARVYVTGPSAFFADVADLARADSRLIYPAVVIGVFLVLVLLLRALLAPVYMVLTVLLSFASTLGVTVLVFQGILHRPGVIWWLPPMLFILLVALGADYNIFLMSRIREEAARAEPTEAVVTGLKATGHVITSAGIILAGTFAVLLLAPLSSLVQMGFATSLGILTDTFLVRSLLVPAISVLVGRGAFWPGLRPPFRGEGG